MKGGFWTDLNLQVTIKGKDITGFEEWVNFSGYNKYDNPDRRIHEAFDFAAYIDSNNKRIVELPSKTPIRTIEDGKIKEISIGGNLSCGDYFTYILIKHSQNDESFYSCLRHVEPLSHFDSGPQKTEVRRGEKIATVYKDLESEGEIPVHLHFELGRKLGRPIHIKGKIDPSKVYEGIKEPKTNLQENKDFALEGNENIEIKYSNFNKTI